MYPQSPPLPQPAIRLELLILGKMKENNGIKKCAYQFPLASNENRLLDNAFSAAYAIEKVTYEICSSLHLYLI